MDKPVSLREVADTLDDHFDELHFFIDRRAGDVVPVMDGDESSVLERVGASAAEIAELAEHGHSLDEYDPERFVRFPHSSEVGTLHAMRDFARSQPPGDARDRLVDSTYGRRLYRRFKDEAARQGLLDAWFECRDRHLAQVAREWLQEEGVAFRDDVAPVSQGVQLRLPGVGGGA